MSDIIPNCSPRDRLSETTNAAIINRLEKVEIDIHRGTANWVPKIQETPKTVDKRFDHQLLGTTNTLTFSSKTVMESQKPYITKCNEVIPYRTLNDCDEGETLATVDTSSSTASCEMIALANTGDTGIQSGLVPMDGGISKNPIINNIEVLNDMMELVDIQDTQTNFKGIPGPVPNFIQFTGQVSNLSCRNTASVTIGNKHVNEIYQDRVIRELPLAKYMWKAAIKNSTKLERISCAVVSISVLFCISIVIYYFLFVLKTGMNDIDQSVWYLSRDQWLAAPFNRSVALVYNPVKLVVVQHSVTPECHDYSECSLAVEIIQKNYIKNHDADIPYSFLVGYDGRIYEGRGWGIMSISSRWLNLCLLSIGYMGDYRHTSPTILQLNRTKMLLAEGVEIGHLDPNYFIVGALDIMPTDSPGAYLYKAIQEFDHYDHNGNKYHRMTCSQIHAPYDELYVDRAPHEWFISRDDWLADPYATRIIDRTKEFKRVKLVIVDDYKSRDCYCFYICRSELSNLQSFYRLMGTEISYNFMIGNDGRVYETRGWGVEPGNITFQFQPCAVFISFFGNYTDYKSLTQATVSQAQVNRTHMLLDEGVRKGYLHQDYKVVGTDDLFENRLLSNYLYEEIKTWERYDNGGANKFVTCDSLNFI